ncbi:hypothetical protein [Cytobacillus purgationiresistens]|uniref:DUF2929 family protein n=1 Tax=Cytobacillus purgationiresistens TaxID=863449 RepID=A0ABU0AP03_9BACI|nr:hypothetical protein [Cytobacillus purgationiresistens]MDQ0273011.1 hypothetical protein [Cytobacillus purgationiresistens]
MSKLLRTSIYWVAWAFFSTLLLFNLYGLAPVTIAAFLSGVTLSSILFIESELKW